MSKTGQNIIEEFKEAQEHLQCNAAILAMRTFAREMEGEAEKAGIYSEEDVVKLIKQIRSETNE